MSTPKEKEAEAPPPMPEYLRVLIDAKPVVSNAEMLHDHADRLVESMRGNLFQDTLNHANPAALLTDNRWLRMQIPRDDLNTFDRVVELARQKWQAELDRDRSQGQTIYQLMVMSPFGPQRQQDVPF